MSDQDFRSGCWILAFVLVVLASGTHFVARVIEIKLEESIKGYSEILELKRAKQYKLVRDTFMFGAAALAIATNF